MDELPIELIKKILKYLPLNNLLLCKKVNRKWYNIIDGLKLTKLAITDSWNFKGEWFPDYQQINQQDIIKIKKLNEFNYEFKSEYQFERIKSLIICSLKNTFNNCCDEDFYFFILLNKLTELECLIIMNLSFNNNDTLINLNQLKNLYVNNFYCNKIVFKSPNLINLKIDNEFHTKVILSYPEKLNSLHIGEIRGDLLKRFRNLEYLHVKYFTNEDINSIIKLSKLLEFHFDPERFEHADAILRLIKSSKFKIFVFGFNYDKTTLNNLNQLENDDENFFNLSFESINFRRQENIIKQYNEYPHKLSNRISIFELLDYNELEQFYNNQIPFDLINRFINLRKLIIKSTINYENQLINLLKLLFKRIKILEINSSQLSQNFFNQLPKLIPIIDCLLIKNEDKKLDFNFLIQFQSIRGVELDQFVPEEILNKFLIKYEDDFKYFNYKENINPIRISFDIFSRTIITCRTQIEETNNSDNLINDSNYLGIDNLFSN